MGYQTRRWKKVDDTFKRFDTVPECLGQTDRRTDGGTELLRHQHRACIHEWIQNAI